PGRAPPFPYPTLFRSVRPHASEAPEHGKLQRREPLRRDEARLLDPELAQHAWEPLEAPLDDQARLRTKSTNACATRVGVRPAPRSEEHTSELQSPYDL